MVVLRNSTLVLNSKDRDVSTDPTNNFNLTLARPVFNVVKAELRYFFLQNGIWNVDYNRNTFDLSLTEISSGTQTNYVISIPPGYYSQQAFITALQAQFDEAQPNGITSVEITDSNNLRLTSTLYTFSITFLLSDIYTSTAILMGFAPNSTTSSVTVGAEEVLYSPLEVNIAPLPYLYLQSSKLQNNLVTSSGLSAFAIVPLTGNLQGVGNADVALGTTYDAGQYSLDASYFTQPITLDRVDIRIVDTNGKFVDTRNNDITIVLRIITSV